MSKMRVKDLIEELSLRDPETIVYINEWEDDLSKVTLCDGLCIPDLETGVQVQGVQVMATGDLW